MIKHLDKRKQKKLQLNKIEYIFQHGVLYVIYFQMEELFFHTTSASHIKFSGDPDKATFVKKAIHLHKVIEPSVMHNLHAYYLRAQEAMEEYCGLKTAYSRDSSDNHDVNQRRKLATMNRHQREKKTKSWRRFSP